MAAEGASPPPLRLSPSLSSPSLPPSPSPWASGAPCGWWRWTRHSRGCPPAWTRGWAWRRPAASPRTCSFSRASLRDPWPRNTTHETLHNSLSRGGRAALSPPLSKAADTYDRSILMDFAFRHTQGDIRGENSDSGGREPRRNHGGSSHHALRATTPPAPPRAATAH